ncbi:glycosyl hydrolase family protein [Hyphomonas adhaerens MHS-3]|uniref:Glycosyl hydrolase family protein n=1 Tax=Hyphomonas adhaerens MHS-3 TaxID=1280949 RepID=A0A069E1F2_9PROT|nr:alpha-amylase family glycosyl hydrolase [Hyphomonas adhaerens]KCZ83343.1 glycosyl hydrolase family protein [Hyphomonas adhaerens MHS-3]
MSESERPWWRGAVLYQIYPRSYLDTNGDGIGDLPGITQKLDYIASLGVDGIWISPFFASPMKDFGYDVSDYCAVDPIFGALEDFDQLLDRAHGYGLKVIIDQVYAHTSDEHAWFTESRQSRNNPKADWYVWQDPKPDGTPPNNWQAVFGGAAWTWDARRQQYFLHNFLPEQPQLNVHNPDVQDALLATARFWLDRGVDGFRLDAINFAMHDRAFRDNPPWDPAGRTISRPFDLQRREFNQSQPEVPEFLKRVRELTDEYGDRYTVAEVASDNPLPTMRSYTQGDDRLTAAYSFDFLYAQTLTAKRVRRSQGNWTGSLEEGWPSWEFSNHDAPRCVSRWYDGPDRPRFAKLTNALLLCLRGNPILYQGEELGLTQVDVPFEALQDPEAIANWPRTLGRDGARTPMPWEEGAPNAGFSQAKPWLPVGADHPRLSVGVQEEDRESVLNFTRRLLDIRKGSPALKWGDVSFVESPEPLLIMVRSSDTETVTCLFNLGASSVEIPEAVQLDGTVLIQSEGLETPLGRDLPPYSFVILRR